MTENGTFDRAGDISNTADLSSSYSPTLMFRKCADASCVGRLYPDGTEFGVFAVNPARTCFVSLLTLYKFLFSRATEGTSFKSFASLIALGDSAAGRVPCVSVNRHSWARFFRFFESALCLPAAEHLQCVLCGDPGSVPAFSIDGTRMGPRIEKMDLAADARPVQLFSTLGKPSDLAFFQHSESRVFADNAAHALRTPLTFGADRGPWTDVFASLVREIGAARANIKADAAPLLPVLERYAADTRASVQPVTTERVNVANLLASCASLSPVGPTFNEPAASVAALGAVLSSSSLLTDVRLQLQRACPLLAKAIVSDSRLPDFLRDIAERFRDIAQQQVDRIALRGPGWLPEGVTRSVVSQESGACITVCPC